MKLLSSPAFTIWTKPYQEVRGFKHIDEGMQCNGFKFKVGERYVHDGEVDLCKEGFHFCRLLNKVWKYKNVFKGSTHFVYCKNVIGNPLDKECCREILIGNQLTFQEMVNLSNSGFGNLGHSNKGHYNKGNYNKGNRNKGSFNKGNYNKGNCNEGN